VRAAAKAFDAVPQVVAPQIAAQIGLALKGIDAVPSFAEAFKSIEPPPFKHPRTFDDIRIPSQFQSEIAEVLKAWEMPSSFASAVADALRDASIKTVPDFVFGTGGAVSEAVVLAEASTGAAVDDAFVDIDDLSSVERRELEKIIVDAIAAFATLVAILVRDGRIELASASLAFLAILVSIYWHVTGKLDR